MGIENYIKKINMMKDNQERILNIHIIIHYLEYLLGINQITETEYNNYINQIIDIDEFLEISNQEVLNDIIDLINSTQKLNSLYKPILEYANNFNLFYIKIPNTNFDKIYHTTTDFFKYLGNDVYSLYEYLYNQNLIIEVDRENFGGSCININNYTSGITLQTKGRILWKILSLVHETGHAYHNYLNHTHPSFSTTKITRECLSITFEQLFLTYLRNNYLLDSNILDIYERFFHFQYLQIINASYIINNAFLNGQIIVPNAMIAFNNKVYTPSKEKYQEQSILDRANYHYSSHLQFSSNYYSYAYLFSNLIRDLYQKDEKETIKFIKEIPYYERGLSLKEFIELFNKSDYTNQTNKNVCRVLKKNYYK